MAISNYIIQQKLREITEIIYNKRLNYSLIIQ